MYYLIKETLTPCDETLAMNGKTTVEPFVAVMSTAEWQAKKDQFDMVIDMDLDPSDVHETKAVVNFDSLTGSFYIPSRRYLSEGKVYRFAFALDENGIVLIDDGTRAQEVVDEIRAGKKWRLPSLERFLYDFLERIIRDDLGLIERTEQRLGKLEEEIIGGEMEAYPMVLNDIRGELLDLRVHYEQLIDMGQELEENENGFFAQENIRYFRLFTERVIRLRDQITSLRDYTVQLRDLFSTQLDIRQNRTMSILTVVTTIFLPLTLIAGWYGMNFHNMPELGWRFGYPCVIIVSIVIVIVCIAFFKKKKWL